MGLCCIQNGQTVPGSSTTLLGLRLRSGQASPFSTPMSISHPHVLSQHPGVLSQLSLQQLCVAKLQQQNLLCLTLGLELGIKLELESTPQPLRLGLGLTPQPLNPAVACPVDSQKNDSTDSSIHHTPSPTPTPSHSPHPGRNPGPSLTPTPAPILGSPDIRPPTARMGKVRRFL